MRRMLLTCLLTTGVTAAQAVPAAPKPSTLSDPQAVVRLLRGEVLLIGDEFPNVTFQQGVLALLRSGTVKVRVLTTRRAAPSLAALKRAGGQVYVMPGDTAMNGASLILSGPDTVIVATGARSWAVYKSPLLATQVKGSLTGYFTYAKLY